MRTRYWSTPIFDLREGDVILTNDNPEQEWTAVKIERRNTNRMPWRITWSSGKTYPYGVNTRFRVKTN